MRNFSCSMKAEKQKEQEMMREEVANRIKSVLTLKHDIARVRDNLSVQQARDRALVKRCDDEEEVRARELEAAGRSPEVELLIEERRERMAFERALFAERQHEQRIDIVERILDDEKADRQRRKMYPHLYHDTRADLPDVSTRSIIQIIGFEMTKIKWYLMANFSL